MLENNMVINQEQHDPQCQRISVADLKIEVQEEKLATLQTELLELRTVATDCIYLDIDIYAEINQSYNEKIEQTRQEIMALREEKHYEKTK